MTSRTLAIATAGALLIVQCVPAPAHADNPMGYRLLSQQEAAALPRNQGALGLDVERAQQISDSGMTFDIIRVTQVRKASAGERAGLKPGDEIIALDGRVFPSLLAFASYIGAAQPGSQIMVDFMPDGGGPQQAQRMAITVGRAGVDSAPAPANEVQANQAPASTGLSTGTKIAIGAGAVALLGCYAAGCFSSGAKSTGGQQQGSDSRR